MQLRLQNGRFDAPDRLFNSMHEAWESVNTSTTDVKVRASDGMGSARPPLPTTYHSFLYPCPLSLRSSPLPEPFPSEPSPAPPPAYSW